MNESETPTQLAGVTLATGLKAIYAAGIQFAMLSKKYPELGRTADVIETVERELQRCAELLNDEIKTLARYGEKNP